MKVTHSVFLVCIIFIIRTVSADSWHIETVESAGDVGQFTSLALDSNNDPHISYLGDGQIDVKYAHWNGSSWSIEVISSEGPSDCTSLVLDSNGYPKICYRKYTGVDALRYARFDGSNWYLSTIDATASTCGLWNSMVMDDSDIPHIAYFWENSGTGGRLKYAYYDDGWVILEPNLADEIGEFASIDLDSNGYPHISCYDETQSGLIEVYRPYGTYWAVSWIDIAGDDVGTWTSIAIDSQNHRHISYYDETNGNLKYAYFNGSSWSLTMLDNSCNSTGFCTSIAVDSNDHPHISYYSPSAGGLRYAHWNGSSWMKTLVDPEWMAGWHTSIAINSDDDPCISYYGNGDLRYAWYGPEVGIDDGDDASLLFTNLNVFPNPSNSSATLSFNLSESAAVHLSIYELSGRMVDVLMDGTYSPGVKEICVSNFPAGIYIAQLRVGSHTEEHRFLVVD